MANDRYAAFISYTRADHRIAASLREKLERFVLPRALRTIKPGIRWNVRPVRPVFLDEDELVPGPTLSGRLDDAIRRSEFLIVLCSPRSANSIWVEREIQAFIAAHGRDHLLAIVAAGEPDAAARGFPAEEECLPRPLRRDASAGTSGDETLWVDWRGRPDRKAFLRIIAGLLGLSSLDVLIRRDRSRIIASRARTAVAALGAVILLSFYVVAQHSRLVTEVTRLTELAKQASDRREWSQAQRWSLAAFHRADQSLFPIDLHAARIEAVRSLASAPAVEIPPGQTRSVTAAAAIPGSSTFLIASVDGDVTIRSADRGRILRRFNIGDRLHELALSPDGTRLARVSGNVLEIMSARDGAPIASMDLPAMPGISPIRRISFVSDRRVLVQGGLPVVDCALDARSCRLVAAQADPPGTQALTDFAPETTTRLLRDGENLLEESLAGTVPQRAAPIAERIPFYYHRAARHGTYAAFATLEDQKLIDVYDIAGGARRYRLQLAAVATAISISADARFLLLGLHDGSFEIRAIESGALLSRMRMRQSPINAISSVGDPGGGLFVAGDLAGNVVLYRSALAPGRVPPFAYSATASRDLGFGYGAHGAFSRNGRRLLLSTSGDGYGAVILDPAAPQRRVLLQTDIVLPFHIELSDDGRRALFILNGGLRVLDGRTGRIVFEREADHGFSKASLSRDGRYLAFSRPRESRVTVVNLDNGETVFQRDFHRPKGFRSHDVALSPDGNRLAITELRRGESGIAVWDLRAGRQEQAVTLPFIIPGRVWFSNDGALLAVTPIDERTGNLYLWDWMAGSAPRRMGGLRGTVLDVAFSPDGRRLATITMDGTTGGQLAYWDVRDLRLIDSGSVQRGNTIFFSGDGRSLRVGGSSQILTWTLPDADADPYEIRAYLCDSWAPGEADAISEDEQIAASFFGRRERLCQPPGLLGRIRSTLFG